jgi:hypothetical protein
MIHIVFNEADVPVLRQAIEMEPGMAGEVWEIKDDYAVGPLTDIFTGQGMEARKAWWRDVLAGGDYDGSVDSGKVDDPAVVDRLKTSLRENPDEIVWIWAAQNKHDVSGYYWLMSQLKDFQGRIFILYLNNLPFINEKGQLFYPQWLSHIPAKEFLKARKLARPITPSEFEVDPDEWMKICRENKPVRLLEGGKKLVQADDDFYDAELQKFITGDWQKASRIIGQFLSKGKETTGDAYLLWRLKKLLQTGFYDVQGEARTMRDFEVKQKVAAGTVTQEA